MKKVLVTGAAGFIGFHLSKLLVNSGYRVLGIDNINDYYDTKLKIDRVAILEGLNNFQFYKMDICNKVAIDLLFDGEGFDYVVHLAAQAGVRYSIENPHAYIESNVVGFVNILEACRHNPVKHLLYASSSSVYGGNKEVPFTVQQRVDRPVSLYAATKKSNELMAYTYSHLYNIPTTGLRFFTVYGPYGRPDMAYFSFTKAIMNGDTIQLFNNGCMERDFTYVADIVEAIGRLLEYTPNSNVNESMVPYEVHNIGNSSPVKLEMFVSTIEEAVGKKAVKVYKPMQPGDVHRTYADVSGLERAIGFKPQTSLEVGIAAFVDWYKDYYGQ